jgi:hypothetical protein
MSRVKRMISIISPEFGELKFQEGLDNIDDFPLTTFSLVQSELRLPSIDFELKISDKHKQLKLLNKEDKVEIELEIDGKDSLLFRGEIVSLEMTHAPNAESKAKVTAFTSFLRFQQYQINSLTKINSLRNLIEAARTLSNTTGKVLIDDDVDDEIFIGSVIKLPIMAVLNHLALEHNLIIEFNFDNSMRIANRLTRIREQKSKPITTFSDDQIRNITIKIN